ncbi:MAG TPA: hypothetical protein VEH81_10470 [Ktedonobacteraceae bacterium]|nr:hypothetical protein [Ktedonobacteraceae bacterium]
MKAILVPHHGSPDVLKLENINKPTVPDDSVLVGVHACSINILDLFALTRSAYIGRKLTGRLKPKHFVPGADCDGTERAAPVNVIQV